VDLLLAAWPLVHARHPGARLLIAGFGAYRDGLERLRSALGDGDLDAARAIAVAGRTLEGGPEGELRHLGAFLADPPRSYAATARGAAGSVEFAGRLEHSEVGELVPATDALVFPSTHPEAFGMVAAEAAAAGVLPVSAAHSGALEVSRALAAELPEQAARLLSFTVDDGAVVAIGERLSGWLELDDDVRERSQQALTATATRLWGWEGVAEKVLAASRHGS
jgi:glycosyltransferase involved in cell wall biosynthesis